MDPSTKTNDVDVCIILVEINNLTPLIWCTNEVVRQVECELRSAMLLLFLMSADDHVHQSCCCLLHCGVAKEVDLAFSKRMAELVG